MSQIDVDQSLRARFAEVVTEPPAGVDVALADVNRRVHDRQRRRVAGRVAAVVVVVAAGAAVVVIRDDPDQGLTTVTGPAESSSSGESVNLLTIGWQEGPRLADPRTGNASPLGPVMEDDWRWCNTCPLVRVADRVYTAQNGRLFAYTPGQGALRDIGTADAVFATSDGQGLLVWEHGLLEERSLEGERVAGPWSPPDGFEPTVPPRAVGGGVIVAIQDGFLGDLAWWDPTSGAVRRHGKFNQFLDVHPGGNAWDDVLAWTTCPTGGVPCSLVLSNPNGRRGSTFSAPVEGNGFYGGGAFSPDGSRLAVTVSTSPGTTDPTAALAIVDVPTGRIDVVDGSEFGVGEPYGYVAWSPDGATVYFTGDSGVRSYRPAERRIVDMPFPGTYYSVAASPGLDRRGQCPGTALPWQLGPGNDSESGDGLPQQGTATREVAQANLDAVAERYGTQDAFIWAEPGRAWSRQPDGSVNIVAETIYTIVVPLNSATNCPDMPSLSEVPLTFLVTRG